MTRVVLYSRFSSDNQCEASIGDQLRQCRIYAEKQGWTIVGSYLDRTVSGAWLFRAGIQDLMIDALDGRFDIVPSKALDRTSRDQEDVAGVFKCLAFAGVKIVTLSEAEITHLHVGLKGTMYALFLKVLADKTRRGLRGRVEARKSGGDLCYGYEVVKKTNAAGELIYGGRRIVSDQAEILRRIFCEFASGLSPRRIAFGLNKDDVPGPDNSTGSEMTIRGHVRRGTGILNTPQIFEWRHAFGRRLPVPPAARLRRARETLQTVPVFEIAKTRSTDSAVPERPKLSTVAAQPVINPAPDTPTLDPRVANDAPSKTSSFPEGIAHAPPSRAESIEDHNATAASSGGGPSRLEVDNPRAGTAAVPDARHQQCSVKPAGLATQNDATDTGPSRTRPRRWQRTDGDIRALFSDDHPNAATERARRGADHWPTPPQSSHRDHRRTSADGSGLGHPRHGDDGACTNRDRSGSASNGYSINGHWPCAATD